MEVFFQSVQGIFIIIGLIAVGYALALRGWFTEDTTKLIAKLVTQIALPAYMIFTITKDFTAHKLITLLPNLVIPCLSMTILIGVSVLMIRLLKIDPKHRGLFSSMFFNSNTVFVGLPVNIALFGSKSLPYVLVYYMANTTFFWTLGTYLIQVDGEKKGTFSWKKTLGKLFSPPLLGFIVGLLLVIFHIQLPSFLMSDFEYLGNLTIPMSMIFIGISIASAGLSNLTLHKENVGVLFGRFICAPLLMSALFLFIPGPALMKQVFIIQAAMPVMTNAPVVAKLYHADSNYAAVMVTETTLMSLVVIPILMMIIK